VLGGNPPGPASTSTPTPETSTKHATVEHLASYMEAADPRNQSAWRIREGEGLRAWIEETRALGLAHFDLVNRYVLT
jgi:hypothetical protein